MREFNLRAHLGRGNCAQVLRLNSVAAAAAKALAVSICLASPSLASAANWTLFAECGDPGQVRLYSYDPASVRKRGEQRIVTLQADYSQIAASKGRSGRIVWAMECGTRSFVEQSRIEYGSGGRIVARYKKPTPSMGINAGSVAEKLFEKVCV